MKQKHFSQYRATRLISSIKRAIFSKITNRAARSISREARTQRELHLVETTHRAQPKLGQRRVPIQVASQDLSRCKFTQVLPTRT